MKGAGGIIRTTHPACKDCAYFMTDQGIKHDNTTDRKYGLTGWVHQFTMEFYGPQTTDSRRYAPSIGVVSSRRGNSREPVSFAHVVTRMLAERGLNQAAARGAVVDQWPAIASALARKVTACGTTWRPAPFALPCQRRLPHSATRRRRSNR